MDFLRPSISAGSPGGSLRSYSSFGTKKAFTIRVLVLGTDSGFNGCLRRLKLNAHTFLLSSSDTLFKEENNIR